MEKPKQHISVCVCTFKRPNRLRRLLTSLATQKTDDIFGFSVVVADNDREGSARPVIDDSDIASDVPVLYVCEPEQNIARARNAAVNNARGDYLAFIDDDEIAPEDWLFNLFRTAQRLDAGCVMGPVIPRYEEEPPSWVVRGRFFDRPHHDTGQVIPWIETRTGNVLLRRELIAGERRPFDPAITHGGEDQDFFRRLIERGCTIRWCAEAPVYESVRSSRWSLPFMIRRALMKGAEPLRHREIARSALLRSIAAVPIYSVLMMPAAVLGRHVFVQMMLKNMHHVGRIFAYLGIDAVGDRYITD